MMSYSRAGRVRIVGFSAALLFLSSCATSEDDSDPASEAATFDSAEEFLQAVTDEGYPCNNPNEAGGISATNMICPNFSLAFWETTQEKPSGETDEEEVRNLRGPNWNVMSSDREMLEDLQASLGGVVTDQGPLQGTEQY